MTESPTLKTWRTAPMTLKFFVFITALLYLVQVVATASGDNTATGSQAADAAFGVISALTLSAGIALTAFLLYKLIKAKRWAWWVMLVLSAFNCLGTLLAAGSAGVVESFQIALSLLALYLLLAESTRSYLG